MRARCTTQCWRTCLTGKDHSSIPNKAIHPSIDKCKIHTKVVLGHFHFKQKNSTFTKTDFKLLCLWADSTYKEYTFQKYKRVYKINLLHLSAITEAEAITVSCLSFQTVVFRDPKFHKHCCICSFGGKNVYYYNRILISAFPNY